jgi:hypothetical protein
MNFLGQINKDKSKSRNILHNRNSKIKSLSKDEEELLYLLNKNNYSNMISNTELNLIKFIHNENSEKILRNNTKRERYNDNLVNQVGEVSNKINYEKSLQEIKRERMYNDILFNNSQNKKNDNNNVGNSYLDKNKISKSKIQIIKSQSSVKNKLLPKLLNYNILIQSKKVNSKKNIFENNSPNPDPNLKNEKFDIDWVTVSKTNVNSDRKYKKNYYVISSKKNLKSKLPPINRFKLNIHNLKLKVNNEIDHTDKYHEDMMKLYKQLEYQNKYRFII